MKKILLPTDFSDNAWNGIVYALDLFRNIPCTFYILNVYSVSEVSLLTTISSQKVGQFYEMAKNESEEGLQDIMEDLEHSKTSEIHAFNSLSRFGNLEEEIKGVIASEAIDLMVMATHGATGAAALLWGSTTQKMVNAIDQCPILIIPDDFRFEGVSEIGFATDFKSTYATEEIDSILELASIEDGTIRVVHVYKESRLNAVQDRNADALEASFKEVSFKFHSIPDYTTVEKAIQTLLEELEVDVLVMINYKHSFMEQLVREPILKKITFHPKIPFLIIPHQS